MSAFSTNAQSRFASVVVDSVLGPPRLVCHTWQCPCISAVLEATHEASRGSEMETRELLGGTEENSVPPMRGHWFALQANQWVFTKRKQKKIELLVRPDVSLGHVHDSVADVQEGGPLVGVVFPTPPHQSIHAVRAVVGPIKQVRLGFYMSLPQHTKNIGTWPKMCLTS